MLLRMLNRISINVHLFSYVIFAEKIFLPQIKNYIPDVFTVFSITSLCIHNSIIAYVLDVTPLVNPRYLPFHTGSCLIIDSCANCYLENSHYCRRIRRKKGRGNLLPRNSCAGSRLRNLGPFSRRL
jgi:hypothetical protein